MRVFKQTISSIVDENYVYARALSYLGIEFYLYPNKKLGELCDELGLVKEQVLRSFYLFDRNHRVSFRELNNYQIPIIIQYLKHTHSVFVKNKLPYIAKLIQSLHGREDLKLIFPEFVDEFIHHLHHEEDTVFNYISQLIKVKKQQVHNPLAVLWAYRDLSLQSVHAEHLVEDEMEGIRALIEELDEGNDLHWKVVVNEIRAFDREMMFHAEIENKILFPKAIALEQEVDARLKAISKLN